MTKLSEGSLRTAIGTLRILCDGKGVIGLAFERSGGETKRSNTAMVRKCRRELAEYFEGRRRKFSVPVRMTGTDFDRSVWRCLKRIPYGGTVSYSEVARRIGRARAARAVGAANRRNPMPILIPCHRVISKTGTLGGYNAGAHRKAWLIQFESAKPAPRGIIRKYVLGTESNRRERS